MSKEPQHHIMVIGGHSLDAEVMAGGIVAKYTKAGHKASIVHMTLGEKGHGTLSTHDYGAQKREEAQRAAAVLGADVYFMPYKDAELEVTDEVKYRLADLIREVKPTVLLTHWTESIHKDHTNTAHIVEDARFYAALPAIERDLPAHGAWGMFYCENWEDPYGYEPDIYVDISDVFDTYIHALEQYEAAHGKTGFRYIDYYRALATARGCLARCDYAQTLMRPRGAGVAKGPAIPGYPI